MNGTRVVSGPPETTLVLRVSVLVWGSIAAACIEGMRDFGPAGYTPFSGLEYTGMAMFSLEPNFTLDKGQQQRSVAYKDTN